MEVKEGRRRRVCVTGAGGYVGSWVVKLLLSNGYTVHGTVRDPGNAKYDHLTKMEKASENLKLLKADLLDYDSLSSAISGCSGVIHIASPVITTPHVPDPQAQVLDPAVKGTSNVVEACVEHKVERVVVVSSLAAVLCNPLWKGRVVDESCWSDPEFLIVEFDSSLYLQHIFCLCTTWEIILQPYAKMLKNTSSSNFVELALYV